MHLPSLKPGHHKGRVCSGENLQHRFPPNLPNNAGITRLCQVGCKWLQGLVIQQMAGPLESQSTFMKLPSVPAIFNANPYVHRSVPLVPELRMPIYKGPSLDIMSRLFQFHAPQPLESIVGLMQPLNFLKRVGDSSSNSFTDTAPWHMHTHCCNFPAGPLNPG